jgi:pimeloyl-ACP methyl ester carboxylesterase
MDSIASPFTNGATRQHHVVACVHGLTRNGRDFDILATHLAQHCRVVSMDVVGRGASEWLVHKGDYVSRSTSPMRQL